LRGHSPSTLLDWKEQFKRYFEIALFTLDDRIFPVKIDFAAK
jgi:hypothetical protein